MALEHVLKDVKTRLFTVLYGLHEPKPSWAIGHKHKYRQDAPPRIVWAPLSGAMSGPAQQGADGVRNPRTLSQRNLQVQARIWHVDEIQADRLMNHLAAAIQDVMPGSWEPVSEDWNAIDDAESDHGVLLVFTVLFKMPLTREPDTTAVLEAVPITGEMLPILEA